MNKVIIDIESKHVKTFIASLRRLKGTDDVSDNGEYNFGGATGYNQLSYTGDMDADGIDEWAYRVKAGEGFIGAVGAADVHLQGDQNYLLPSDDKITMQAEVDKVCKAVYPVAAKAVKATASRNKREGAYMGKYLTKQYRASHDGQTSLKSFVKLMKVLNK